MEDKFFDRKQYLDILEKRISDLKHGYRQNIAIVGDEFVGKTSIIYKFLDSFCDNQTIVLYLQTKTETLPSFAKRFIGILLYNFLVNSGIKLEENIGFLINQSAKYIPKTVEKIKIILKFIEGKKKNNIFTELLCLCDILNQETGKYSVVIFDEFQNLETIGIKNLYLEWSRLLMTQKNTMYIIVSSMKFKTKTILSTDLSLLFGNFEMIEVEPFDTKSTEEYLELRIKKLNFSSGLENFIVHFTGGYPFYLEVITGCLLKSNQIDSNEVPGYFSTPHLSNIIQDLLFESSGILNQRFSAYLKRFLDSSLAEQYLSILYLISSGHNKFKDIAHILARPKNKLKVYYPEAKNREEGISFVPRNKIDLRINELLESDLIGKTGDFFKLNDRVFGFWLKFVYRKKSNSLTFDARNQKVYLKNYIEDMIQEFLVNASKPIEERITELLYLFTDDTIQIDKKRLKLDRFREIKSLEFNNRSLEEGLIGRSNDSIWIVAFRHDMLTEDFVAEFSKECKRYRHKTQKKVIVTLKDIDANARLRALEEKIWMWDVNNINQLLDLFSKPRIIV